MPPHEAMTHTQPNLFLPSIGPRLGYKGLQSCLGSALLALTAPVPIVFPALACWHLSQRRRLMDMYNFKPDPADRCSSLASEDMRALCCLPCALGQEMAFLEAEAAEGGLRFPWESGRCAHPSTRRPRFSSGEGASRLV